MIHFFEATDQERTYIESALRGEKIAFHAEALTTGAQAAAIGHDATIVSVFVHSKLGPDVIEALPHLKMIATRSTGFDHQLGPLLWPATMSFFDIHRDAQLSPTGPDTSAVGSARLIASAYLMSRLSSSS